MLTAKGGSGQMSVPFPALYGDWSAPGMLDYATMLDESTTDYSLMVTELDTYTIDGNDVEKVYDTVSQAVAKARSGGGPSIVECKTYRQHGHNGGDPGRYRKEGELEYWKSRDPLKLFREAGYLNEDEIAAIEAQVEQEIQEACKFAVDSPYPDESDLMKGIFCE